MAIIDNTIVAPDAPATTEQDATVAPTMVGDLGLTDVQLLELILGALVEIKMYLVAFIALYVIFQIVRWRK